MKAFKICMTLVAGLALLAHVLYLGQPYFMDEDPILKNHFHFAQNLSILPSHSKYPTFYSYVSFPGTGLVVAYEWLFGAGGSPGGAAGRLYYFDRDLLVLPARMISLIVLLLGVVCVTIMNRRFGGWVSLLSGLCLLATPGLMRYGAFALPDILVLTLSGLCLLLLLRALEASEARAATRAMILASISTGLAISSKYNGIAVIPAIAITGFLLCLENGGFQVRRFVTLALVSMVSCTLAFLIGSPGWVLSFDFFLAGFMHEVWHAKAGHLGGSGVPVLGQIELLLTHFPLLFPLSIAGIIVWVMRDRDRAGLVALTLVVSGLATSAQSSKQSIQYLYVIVPAMIFFFGVFWQRTAELIPRGAPIAGLLVAAIATMVSLWSASTLLRPNTTDMTADWLAANIAADHSIALDWAYVPNLYSEKELSDIAQNAADPGIPTALRAAQPTTRIERHNADPAYFDGDPADYIVVSDAAYRRFFNSGYFTRLHPPEGTGLARDFNTRRAFYSRLFESGEWEVIYEADTGHGPRTLVFAPTSER